MCEMLGKRKERMKPDEEPRDWEESNDVFDTMSQTNSRAMTNNDFRSRLWIFQHKFDQ